MMVATSGDSLVYFFHEEEYHFDNTDVYVDHITNYIKLNKMFREY